MVSLLMDWALYRMLRSWSRSFQSSRSRTWFLKGYLFVAMGITVLLLLRLGSFRTVNGMRPLNEWILSLFLTLFFTKLVFIITWLFVEGLASLFGKWKGQNSQASFSAGRRRFVTNMAFLAAAVPFGAFLYAMVKGKYEYTVRRITIYFEDLPAAFDGFTITQLSDIHSGSFDNRAAVQKGVQLAMAQQSDLFVFTGDLVNNSADEIKPYLSMFGAIKAPYGQYSILGNHDYGDYIHWDNEQQKADNLAALQGHHAAMDYRLLMDEHVNIQKDGASISLLGVQNWGRGFIQKGNLDKALQHVPPEAFKILLSHDPTHWEDHVRHHPVTVQLTLSGHTHGAQFGVETDKLRWSPVQYRYLNWAGLLTEGKRNLYVNRGFGFLAFSGRLGIWPEITRIELKRK
ncbi:MAG TPA: metallophosphoesterase [Chitinophagaceae bacterium]|nr:metallophosphoesterase [Chitinophagaceae bacterium]